jgi:hypothetical protein
MPVHDSDDETQRASSTDMVVMSAEDAMRAMQAGNVPTRLHVEGDLLFYRQSKVPPPRVLPTEQLVAGSIVIHDASLLKAWPREVRCHQLYLWNLQVDFPSDALLAIEEARDAQTASYRAVNLQDCPRATHLPESRITSLNSLRITKCPQLAALPGRLAVGDLAVSGCPSLSRLPDELHAGRVSLSGCTALTALPDDLVVTEALDLANCNHLARLPDVVDTLQLSIANCSGLQALPSRLRSLYIDMSGCTSLTRWDDPEVTTLHQLSVRGCTIFESLPPNLRHIHELDVSGCPRLMRLPDEVHVTRWVDVGGSGVQVLPASAQGVQVRWNGVNVTGQVAFHPETLTARQALGEENAELRRVMLERIGAERFVAEVQPQELDADTDAGGTRRLLRVAMPQDEPLVALQVRDPSTGRQYMLRVPPQITTCRRAAAWIAGFENPQDYQLVMET